MIRLGHTNMRVADLERSVKFYEDAFGLKAVKRISKWDYSIIWMCDEKQLGEELPFFLELRCDMKHEGAYDLGENSTHIAFVVDDIPVMHLLHSNMGIIYDEYDNGIYFVHDPDGYCVEVMPRTFVTSALRSDV